MPWEHFHLIGFYANALLLVPNAPQCISSTENLLLRPIPVDWVEQVWAKYLRPIKRNLFLTNLPKVFEFVSHHDALNLPKISPFATSLLTPLSSDQFSAVKLISSHCCPTSSPSVIFTSIASLDKPKRICRLLGLSDFKIFSCSSSAVLFVLQPLSWLIHRSWCLCGAGGVPWPPATVCKS